MKSTFGFENYTRSARDLAFAGRSRRLAAAAAAASSRALILAARLFDLHEQKEYAIDQTPALDQKIARVVAAFRRAEKRAARAEARIPARGIRP